MPELLTVKQIAQCTGVSERMLHHAMKVHRHGIDALNLAVEAGTFPLHRAATIAALPHDAQPGALAAALRGERQPKRPTKAERLAAEVKLWQTRCGLLALDLERLTGRDAVAIMDGAIARYPGGDT